MHLGPRVNSLGLGLGVGCSVLFHLLFQCRPDVQLKRLKLSLDWAPKCIQDNNYSEIQFLIAVLCHDVFLSDCRWVGTE